MNDQNCPPSVKPRMAQPRREAEVNSALCDLQLKLGMTDVDMVLALLGWVRKTLTYNTVREVSGNRATRWRGKPYTASEADDLLVREDSLPETLKPQQQDL